MATLGVDDDASCIITHAYQPCLLQLLLILQVNLPLTLLTPNTIRVLVMRVHVPSSV